MQNIDLEPLRVGDRVCATGVLREDGSSHRLLLRGEGIYGELFNATDDLTTPVIGLTGAPLGGMVTVRGVWTGEAIVEAVASEGGRGVSIFARLDESRFAGVEGVGTRSEILRPEVLDACDGIRGGALVQFLALRGPRGWFGLASALDVAAVRTVLGPLLGAHLHVVRSEWSLTDVYEAQDAASVVTDDIYESGAGWDADGRFRAHMLVHHISPELAAAVKRFPAEILHVEAWLTHAE